MAKKVAPREPITKANMSNEQMGDIQSLMEAYGISEEEAIKEYNKAMDIPFDPSAFNDWDNDEEDE